MNKLEKKIRLEIKSLQKQLRRIKRLDAKFLAEEDKLIDEDFKFLNAINPFYKQKFNSKKSTMRLLLTAIKQTDLEIEIERLQKLIKRNIGCGSSKQY